MSHQPPIPREGTLKTYWLGLFLCVALTLAAYYIVVERAFSRTTLLWAVTLLAIVQFFVQMFLFLHLGQEKRPHWNTLLFLSMAMILGIIVGGSLWIMYNLDYRMMVME